MARRKRGGTQTTQDEVQDAHATGALADRGPHLLGLSPLPATEAATPDLPQLRLLRGSPGCRNRVALRACFESWDFRPLRGRSTSRPSPTAPTPSSGSSN